MEPNCPTTAAALAVALAELQNLLLDRTEVTDFLHQVTTVAVDMVGGARSCGITLRRGDQVATVANSDPFAAAVDEIQYGQGQGPCLQALDTGRMVAVDDLAVDDERWGDYRIHALAYGVRSSLSLPLSVAGHTRGALNIYATTPHQFDQAAIGHCQSFAGQVSTALTLMNRAAEHTVLDTQLQQALASRAVIDQAIGVIMGQTRTTASDAFAVLRETSQTTNRKLVDIAADLIHTLTGQPPTPPRPFTPPR